MGCWFTGMWNLISGIRNVKTLHLTSSTVEVSFSGLHRYIFKRNRFVGIHIPTNNQVKILSIMHYQGSAHVLKQIAISYWKWSVLKL
ncbi:hypothetical protein AtNW77_Chr3g0195251 [Arabidopsis thaliana]